MLRYVLLGILLLAVGCGENVDKPRSVSHQELRTTDMMDAQMAGACSSSVIAVMKQPINEFYLTDCAYRALGARAPAEKCVRDHLPELNVPANNACLSCYGEGVQCTSSKCRGACLFNPCSTGCIECGQSNCGAALSACTGFSLNQLPQCRRNKP